MPTLDELDVALIIDMLPEELERPDPNAERMPLKEFLDNAMTLQSREDWLLQEKLEDLGFSRREAIEASKKLKRAYEAR